VAIQLDCIMIIIINVVKSTKILIVTLTLNPNPNLALTLDFIKLNVKFVV